MPHAEYFLFHMEKTWLVTVVKGRFHYKRFSYTRRQINLYRMFFADFSVNSQPILMKILYS